MAGICTVLGPDANRRIKRICESLRHRGPDDEGYCFDKDVALGHRALKLGNSPVVHQPLANEDKTIWITFDGEIYDKAPIIQQLQKDHTLDTDSSAELVVHSYEEDGPDCVNRFNGMFAFCLWDSNRRTLFSARDRVGSKPLYYYESANHFIFSSEIKGILADPSIPKKPNNRFICDYLVRGFPSRNGNSFFEGIKELMPAHCMLLNNDGSKLKRYWHPAEHSKHRIAKSDESYASEFRQLLQHSTDIRLPPGLPVGTLLSGGLDSTSIAFIVNDLTKSAQRAHGKIPKLQELFSAVYKEPTEQGDEIRYIKQVEDALKNKVNYVFPSVMGRWEDIKRFVFYIEEPVAVFNYYVFWCLFQAASKKVKIVFSGQGCDATLGGQTDHCLTYYGELWRKRKIGVLLGELIRSSDWILPNLAYKILFKRNAESRAKTLLKKEFVNKYDQNSREKYAESLQEALTCDLMQHAPEYLRVDDRASSTFSIECRHPFLDNKTVEFAFSLPSAQRIRKGMTKYVMRNAVKGIIPETIRKKRKKSGTPIPQQRWMNELHENIMGTFGTPKFQGREYFNQPVVLNMFSRYCSGKLNRIEREHWGNLLWRILNLELWLEIFFGREDTID